MLTMLTVAILSFSLLLIDLTRTQIPNPSQYRFTLTTDGTAQERYAIDNLAGKMSRLLFSNIGDEEFGGNQDIYVRDDERTYLFNFMSKPPQCIANRGGPYNEMNYWPNLVQSFGGEKKTYDELIFDADCDGTCLTWKKEYNETYHNYRYVNRLYVKKAEQKPIKTVYQCLSLHPTPQHDLHKNQFEQIRSDVNEKLDQIDQIRSNALANLDHHLTSLQQDYDKTKTQIDLAHTQYQQVLNQIYNDCLSSLSSLQRDEEMRLIDKLETIQKGSQSFDDSRSVFQRCLSKCSLNELVQLKTKLFDDKLNSFQQLFQIETTNFKINDEHQQKHDLVQFISTPIQDFQQSIKLNFGQLIKPQAKPISSPSNNHHQRGSLLSSTNGDSVSSSSGVGSIGVGQISSRGTILSNGVSPSGTNREDYFGNNSTNETEPVVENLRALESIFVNSLPTIHPNVQSNLEQILQMNQHQQIQQHENPYAMLTRQASAPPLGQRSPPNNLVPYPPPSLLATYSSTNSGGSSNGNNSRSTTPFSGVIPNSTIDINLNVLSQASLIRLSGQSMQVRAKFGSLGPQKCQFNAPHGFCLGIDEEIIFADTNNHRIQIFDKSGEYKYQFGMPGKEEGQLWYPRKVAFIRTSGKFVICDRGNERSRMQIFTRNGHFIRKISIRYVDIVAGLAISQQGNIVVVDSVSPTVFCISEAGDLIKWFDCSDYMREPSDIAIFNNEYFVCDFKGHCVAVFDEDGAFLRRIGSESVTNFPNGIDISDAGDVIIGDSHGNRFHLAVFTRTGDFLQEFDCPYVKVSRCCGLKIISDGFIVTLAKNNHHVVVLNTLYLT